MDSLLNIRSRLELISRRAKNAKVWDTIPRVTASSTPIEITVRWNFDIGSSGGVAYFTDLSEGNIVSSDTAVWVDGVSGLQQFQPALFGDDISYMALLVSDSVTRNSDDTRPLYKIVAISSETAVSFPGYSLNPAAFAAGACVATVYTAISFTGTQASIVTTIAGDELDNIVPAQLNRLGPAFGGYYDFLYASWSGILALPDSLAGRGRGATFVLANGSGRWNSSTADFNCNLDFGEEFTLELDIILFEQSGPYGYLTAGSSYARSLWTGYCSSASGVIATPIAAVGSGYDPSAGAWNSSAFGYYYSGSHSTLTVTPALGSKGNVGKVSIGGSFSDSLSQMNIKMTGGRPT